MLLMILTFLPFFLVMLSYRFYRKEAALVSGGQRGLFLTGLAANTISATVLISFTIHADSISKGTTPVDLDRMYPVLWMLSLGFLASILALAGKQISRLILLGTGLFTAVLWYVVGLAASP